MSALGGSGKSLSKDDLVKAIREANAQQNLKFFVGRLHELCFEKCITAPGSSLSRNDEACISNCVRKYVSMHDVISKEWNSSIQKMQASAIHN